ncbi:MAG: hypothetical protein QOC62_3860 [Mycobacterium sp.]|jgi:hypothetical protein|nr:hypothetical protein [Mycobacterium sp.]
MLDRVLDVIGGAPLLQRVGSRPGLITGRRDDQVQPRGGDVDASLRIRGEPWAGDPLCADDDVFVDDEDDEETMTTRMTRRMTRRSTSVPGSSRRTLMPTPQHRSRPTQTESVSRMPPTMFAASEASKQPGEQLNKCDGLPVQLLTRSLRTALSSLLGRRRALHSTFPALSETVASSGAQREIHAIRHFCRHGRCGPFGRGLRVVR